jgi:hypothetical protein
MFRVTDVLVLRDGEKIHAVLRQHGWTLFLRLLLAGALIVLPFFFLFTLTGWGKIGLVIFTLSVAIGLIIALRSLLMWDADVFIVTSHRLVDVDQRGVFMRAVSETPLAMVHDVRWERQGIGQNLLRLGTLRIRTNGPVSEWLVPNLPRPASVQTLIQELREDAAPAAGVSRLMERIEHANPETRQNIDALLGKDE